MKTYDLKNADGQIFAFEVDNCHLRRNGLCRLVARIPGCIVVRKPKLFRWPFNNEDEFCEFELDGVRFVALEPWGDSSRYWVGPKSEGTGHLKWSPQVDRVREAFVRANPLFGMLFGNI